MTGQTQSPAADRGIEADIRFLYAQGNSAPMIAAKLGVSRTRVHRALGNHLAYERIRVWRKEAC